MYQQNYNNYSSSSYKPYRQRGGCLWILLLVGTLGAIGNLFNGFSPPDPETIAAMSSMFGEPPEWYFTYTGFSQVIGLICLIGLWMWKRWGWYGMLVLNGIGIVISVISGFAVFLTIAASAVSLAIWWAVLNPYWDSMD